MLIFKDITGKVAISLMVVMISISFQMGSAVAYAEERGETLPRWFMLVQIILDLIVVYLIVTAIQWLDIKGKCIGINSKTNKQCLNYKRKGKRTCKFHPDFEPEELKMKIYFAGAIRGGTGKKEDYKQIIAELSKFGKVLTEHIGGKRARKIVNEPINELKGEPFIYERDMFWLKQSDLVVADLSVTSWGVGYEIGVADGAKKEILLIWDRKFIADNQVKISALAKGNRSTFITRMPYSSLNELYEKLTKYMEAKSYSLQISGRDIQNTEELQSNMNINMFKDMVS